MKKEEHRCLAFLFRLVEGSVDAACAQCAEN